MKKYYEYKNVALNANKFWEITWKEKKVTVTYGRIGIDSPQQRKLKLRENHLKAKKKLKPMSMKKLEKK